MKLLPLLICLLLLNPVYSQDFGWWNQKHNWDGVTHWTNYLIIAPEFMGPNALPVPEIKTGQLDSGNAFTLAAETHLSTGDDTYNLFADLRLRLFSNRVKLAFQMVPVEYYMMDTITRDYRRTRDRDGKGFSSGDVYIGTHIQLIRNHQYLPDILLGIQLKTASGGNLGAARFTDSPGYYFDLSTGKNFVFVGSSLKQIRAYVMMGFYVWQTFNDERYQNDAILYGFGLDFHINKYLIKNGLGGYLGYIGRGDSPQVYRFEIHSQYNQKLNGIFRFQAGLNDFKYRSLSLGAHYRF